MNKIILLLLFVSGCSHFQKAAWVFSSNPYADDPASAQRGKMVYQKQCLSCHGKSGLGDGPNSKNLKTTPANLIDLANNHWDSTFAARVAYGKSSNEEMPRFVDSLTEQEIWDVTNYIYSLKQ